MFCVVASHCHQEAMMVSTGKHKHAAKHHNAPVKVNGCQEAKEADVAEVAALRDAQEKTMG
jgi:hypothetical protein